MGKSKAECEKIDTIARHYNDGIPVIREQATITTLTDRRNAKLLDVLKAQVMKRFPSSPFSIEHVTESNHFSLTLDEPSPMSTKFIQVGTEAGKFPVYKVIIDEDIEYLRI